MADEHFGSTTEFAGSHLTNINTIFSDSVLTLEFVNPGRVLDRCDFEMDGKRLAYHLFNNIPSGTLHATLRVLANEDKEMPSIPIGMLNDVIDRFKDINSQGIREVLDALRELIHEVN